MNNYWFKIFFLVLAINTTSLNASFKPAKSQQVTRINFLDELRLREFESKVPGYSLERKLADFLQDLSNKENKQYFLDSLNLPLKIKIVSIAFLLTKEPFFSLDDLLFKMAKASYPPMPYVSFNPFDRSIKDLYSHDSHVYGPRIPKILKSTTIDTYKERLENLLRLLLAKKQEIESKEINPIDSKELARRSEQRKADKKKKKLPPSFEPDVESLGSDSEASSAGTSDAIDVIKDKSDQSDQDTESLGSDAGSEKNSPDSDYKSDQSDKDTESLADDSEDQDDPGAANPDDQKKLQAAEGIESAAESASCAAASCVNPIESNVLESINRVPFFKTATLDRWNYFFSIDPKNQDFNCRVNKGQIVTFLEGQGYFKDPTKEVDPVIQSRAKIYKNLSDSLGADDDVFLRLVFLHSIPYELTTLVLSMFYDDLMKDDFQQEEEVTISIPIKIRVATKQYENFKYTLICQFDPRSRKYKIFHELLSQLIFEKLSLEVDQNYDNKEKRIVVFQDEKQQSYLIKDKAIKNSIFYKIDKNDIMSKRKEYIK
ncbi:MAG: hypothetical protein EBU90_12690 [Proteobacteria bacterium]|nr:hypothetical protein [Pseudomonadota bacterium]NBP14841.1 hypothetical protein [bacterium]